jgi:hypothetical protein
VYDMAPSPGDRGPVCSDWLTVTRGHIRIVFHNRCLSYLLLDNGAFIVSLSRRRGRRVRGTAEHATQVSAYGAAQRGPSRPGTNVLHSFAQRNAGMYRDFSRAIEPLERVCASGRLAPSADGVRADRRISWSYSADAACNQRVRRIPSRLLWRRSAVRAVHCER